MAVEGMSAYERETWEEIGRWREKRLAGSQRRLQPRKVRERLARTTAAARERLEQLPGSEQMVEIMRSASEGLLGLLTKATEATLRRNAVIAAYNKRGHAITELSDIRKLDLREVDKVMPRLGLYYTAASTAEGAAAGLAVSGGELVAAAGGVAGAGAGAAPGAGTVVGAMAADAAAVLVLTTRAIAHTAAYYGYDTELPQERVFALGILNFGLARQTGKSVAYVELNKIVQSLARNAAWAKLNRNAVTQVVKIVYNRLGMRLTKQKLGQAVPVFGIAIGAGLNAQLLANVTSDAEHLYRERFLRDKYGLGFIAVTADPIDDPDDPIHIADLVNEELADT
jgi:EcsC protein family